jgi:hypothetical protein
MTTRMLCAVVLLSLFHLPPAKAADLRVGAAAVELAADDSMATAGGIGPGRARGQEGKLRATAVVLEKSGTTLAIVSCDVLMLTRDLLDPLTAQIERTCGIPAAQVMIAATHTHHAPSTIRIHGCEADPRFCKELQKAIPQAVREAQSRLADASFAFGKVEERGYGANSRLQLKDGTIYWVGPRDDAVAPTGPFDPDLSALAFRGPEGKLQALLFNHSTHTIGTLKPGVRSPSFYGLAAQAVEQQRGGIAAFLEGASGSTHNLDVKPQAAFDRIQRSLFDALDKAEPQPVDRLAAIRRPLVFKVRTFDEAAEEKAVLSYCRKRIGEAPAEQVAKVFREMRKELAPMQGQERTTWLQVMRIGPVAVVGVPAEFFTKLGLEVKHRSPYKHTVVVELANDWIGYTPDREAHKLGGYQTWTGLHSYAEPGTGERLVDEAVKLLGELKG